MAAGENVGECYMVVRCLVVETSTPSNVWQAKVYYLSETYSEEVSVTDKYDKMANDFHI